jgi:hypothetical protein
MRAYKQELEIITNDILNQNANAVAGRLRLRFWKTGKN